MRSTILVTLALAALTACEGSTFCETSRATPAAGIILGESTGVPTLALTCTAATEDREITDLVVGNCVTIGEDEDGACADTFETPGNDEIAKTATIAYRDEYGTEHVRTTYFAGGEATFTGLEAYVAVGSPAELEFTISTNPVSGLVQSGDRFQMNLKEVEYRGVTTSVTTVVTEPENGKPMVIRKTEPTFIPDEDSPSGAGVPGYEEVFRFGVAADSRGDVDLEAIVFKVTTTDTDGSEWNTCDELGDRGKWTLYYEEDGVETQISDADDWEFRDAVGDNCMSDQAVQYVLLDFDGSLTTDNPVIPAGSDMTFILKIDTTDASSDPSDSIQIDIADQEEIDALGFASVPDAVRWNDGTSTILNIDGEYLRGLPLTGGTITY